MSESEDKSFSGIRVLSGATYIASNVVDNRITIENGGIYRVEHHYPVGYQGHCDASQHSYSHAPDASGQGPNTMASQPNHQLDMNVQLPTTRSVEPRGRSALAARSTFPNLNDAQTFAEPIGRTIGLPEDNIMQPRALAPAFAGRGLDEQLPNMLENLAITDAVLFANDKEEPELSTRGRIALPLDHVSDDPPVCVSVHPRKVTRSNRAALTDATNIYSTAVGVSAMVDTKASIPKKSSRVRIKKEVIE